MLIDGFLNRAIEVDVDAICDRDGDVFIAGIMEHIEEAGVHSGDSACSLPPRSLSPETIAEIERQTIAMAKALKVQGLMNVQYAIQGDEIYVLEVNPRASRTVPFVAKAIGLPVAAIAARVMAGETLASLNLQEAQPQAHLGQGSGAALRALPRRRQHPGAGDALHRRGDGPRREFRPRLRQEPDRRRREAAHRRHGVHLGQGRRQGPDRGAGARTGWRWALRWSPPAAPPRCWQAAGLKVTVINKVLEGRPHVVDALKNGEIHLVFNTTDGAQALADSTSIRRAALTLKVPYYTTMAGRRWPRPRPSRRCGRAALEVAPLQSYSL